MFAELLVPLAVTLVFFAGGNHRMPERRVRRLAFQAVCLIVVFTVTDIVVTTLL